MSIEQFGNPGPHANGAGYPADQRRSATPANANEIPLADDSMERVRELIIGDLRRSWDARLHVLETRVQLLEDKLDALRHEGLTARDEQVSGLAQGIEELGHFIRRMKRP